MYRALILVAMAACVPSPGTLRGPVDREVSRRLGGEVILADPEAAKRIAERLAKPLDLDGAVRIALANNARVRAALAELEIAGGGLAVMLGPTTIEAEIKRYGDGSEIEISVMQELLGVITAARQRSAARNELSAARASAAGMSIRLAARVERAFYDLLATKQNEELFRTVFEAADAAALLRERMHAAGNTPDLALARDRAAREDARVMLGRAEAAVEHQREVINSLLGLTGEQTKWTFDGRLPELPAAAPALDTIETVAVTRSLDLAAQRARVDATTGNVALQRLRSVIPHIGAGVSVTEDDGNRLIGPGFEIGLPLFDWNAGGRARARGERDRATHQLTAVAIELRAGARAARITALATYAEARHLRDVVIPLRQQVVDQTVLHYNAMDADPFALINARQDLAETGARYIDALRRFSGAMAAIRALERGVLLDMQGPMEPGQVLDRQATEALH
jgi:outer membrane protein TolC